MSTPLRERPDAPLGTLIFRAGLLPAETIENALEEGVKTGRRLGEILVERNLIKEEDLTRLLAGQTRPACCPKTRHACSQRCRSGSRKGFRLSPSPTRRTTS
jgi:hypothetical protein